MVVGCRPHEPDLEDKHPPVSGQWLGPWARGPGDSAAMPCGPPLPPGSLRGEAVTLAAQASSAVSISGWNFEGFQRCDKE